MIDCLRLGTFWKSCRSYIKNSKKKGREGKHKKLKNAIFQMTKLSLIIFTGSKGETLVSGKLHENSDQILIPKKSKAACRYSHNARQGYMPLLDRQIDKKFYIISVNKTT